MRGLSLVAASGGHSSSRCAGLSLSRLRSTSSRHAGSVVVAHGPSCSAACGIFPDQGSNRVPCIGSQTPNHLRHQGSPHNSIIKKWPLLDVGVDISILASSLSIISLSSIYVFLLPFMKMILFIIHTIMFLSLTVSWTLINIDIYHFLNGCIILPDPHLMFFLVINFSRDTESS